MSEINFSASIVFQDVWEALNNKDDEGESTFTFFDTVTGKFCEFSGYQSRNSIDDFVIDLDKPDIDRFLNLIPENIKGNNDYLHLSITPEIIKDKLGNEYKKYSFKPKNEN